MNKTLINLDIVSDVVCPWCIIGYKRLEKALESFSDDIQANLQWHPFELNPGMPQGGENLRSHLAAKYGTTLEGSIKARANLTQLGTELGFRFNYFDEMRMYNTFKAHQLLHWAGEYNKALPLKMRLFSAFFSERKAIDDPEVLIAEAAAVGLAPAQAEEVLASERYAQAVRDEQRHWTSLGIQAVPAFVFNKQQLLSGAQPVETFQRVLQQLVKGKN